MFGLLLLLGMVPPVADSLPLGGAPVASGPYAPHLDNDPATQWHLGAARASWREFQQVWPGRWGVRWDPRNATPRFLYAPGVPADRAAALVADVARLGRVPAEELRLARTTKHDDRVIRQWTRTWRGAPVEGDQVAVVAIGGRIAAVWAQLTPLSLTPLSLRDAPRAGERVLPGVDKGSPRLVRRATEGSLVVYRDRSNAVVHRYDPRAYGDLSSTYEERTVGDALLTGPARAVTLTDTSGATDVSADDGGHALSGPVEALLDGPTLAVTDNGAQLRVTTTADGTIAADTDIPYAAATVLHHFHVVWDWLGDRWPTHAWLGSRVPADVRKTPGSCNAYYTSGTINFFPAEPGSCNDLGRIADVVYHEVGHGIHEYILAAGTFAGDVSEGSADYIAASILDDPTLAPNAWADGSAIREIDTDKRYPDDVVNEVHADGLIWASFLWNLRTDWGADAADALFLGALEQGPTLTDAYEAVLVSDDDDGDLTNGTPNACELMERLAVHGLGPGPIGVVAFDHTPPGAQSSWAEGYEVSFTLADLLPDCGGLDEDSVALWYSAGNAPVPEGTGPAASDTGDTGGAEEIDTWAPWRSVSLIRAGDTWTGTIPRQVAASRVRYFIQAASDDGTQVARADGGDEEAVYSFWVGDRAIVWCDDFEGGLDAWTHGVTGTGTTDEWAVGTATGAGAWDPDAPVDGLNHVATVVDGNYEPNNAQMLTSPVISVGVPGPMTLLSYQRWLTVEDALYDHADLYLGTRRAWGNAFSPSGSNHHLDVAWTAHELPISGLLEADGSTQLTWTLSSDQGLEYGGWAIDEVCVVTLADVPGHYRVRDLVATDAAEDVAITWSQPWMAPLSATVLVRSADGYPTGPDDGLILDVDFSPQPGEGRLVVDTDAQPGEVFYYALFAAGTNDEDWQLLVVEGENADVGGVPEEPGPVDTAEPEDTAPPEDTDVPDVDEDEDADPVPEDETGCGCATGGGDALPLLGVGAALLVGRRRRVARVGRVPSSR